MYKLTSNNYKKVKHLITSCNEISVFSVLDELMPGEVYVNDIENPTAALIRTCECNLLAGSADDNVFNTNIAKVLDFWDEATPDSVEWFNKIPIVHKNQYIRKFKRRHYVLTKDNFKEKKMILPNGFVVEKIDLDLLRSNSYQNADKILKWAEDWGSDDAFYQYGAGNYIRNGNSIVSWSLSDCCYHDKITIGVHTDIHYRKQGFGIMAVSATVRDCLSKGYNSVNWLCVDTNIGSISIAEKLGFTYQNEYFYFCSYLPVENLSDISEASWNEWGEYLENASKNEPELMNECLYTYIKANNVNKAIRIAKRMSELGKRLDFEELERDIRYFQHMGLCSNFNNKEWIDFITE